MHACVYVSATVTSREFFLWARTAVLYGTVFGICCRLGAHTVCFALMAPSDWCIATVPRAEGRFGSNSVSLNPSTALPLYTQQQTRLSGRGAGGSAFATRRFAIRPADGLVGLKRLADHRELARLFGILGAALERIGAKHEQRVHRVSLEDRWRSLAHRWDPFIEERVAQVHELADGRRCAACRLCS